MVPFLPEGVQRRLGVRQYGFPPANPQDLNHAPVPAPEAHAEQALQPEDVPAEEAAVFAGVEAPAEDVAQEEVAVFAAVEAPAEDAPQAEGNPAPWSLRCNLLGKKAVGNAARCFVSLGASAAGTALGAAVLVPIRPLWDVGVCNWWWWGAGAGLAAAIVPVAVLALACNAVDLVVSIFITGPDLNDWYEYNNLPWRTFSLALVSAAVTVAVLKQASQQRTKFA